jgi:hypothetical protein
MRDKAIGFREGMRELGERSVETIVDIFFWVFVH